MNWGVYHVYTTCIPRAQNVNNLNEIVLQLIQKSTLAGSRSEAGKRFLVESEVTCMLLGRKETSHIMSISFCCYHILSYSLGSFFYQYMVVFLFNTVIYVFLL